MLRLVPLEERIVLDAALMVELAEAREADSPDDDDAPGPGTDEAPGADLQHDTAADGAMFLAALELLDEGMATFSATQLLSGIQYREGDGYRAVIEPSELPVLDEGFAIWAVVALEDGSAGDVIVPPSLGPGSGFVVSSPSAGVISFSLSAQLLAENTPQEAEELLRNTVALVRYANVSQDPVEGVRNLSFTLGNGTHEAMVSRPLLLSSFNDAPVISDTSPVSLSFFEPTDPASRAPLALFAPGSLTIRDADSANLTQASVWISDSPASAADALGTLDRLSVALPADGSLVASLVFRPGADGVVGELRLTVSGVAAPDTYARVLESVHYDNLDTDPRQYSRTVRISVTDLDDDGVREDASSVSLEKRIVIEPTNTAPSVSVADGQFSEAVNRTGYVPLLPELRLLDPDSNNLLSKVVVTIANPDGPPSDFINTFAGGSALFTISRVSEGTTEVYTVRPTAPTATVGEFQTLLSAWTYANSSRANVDHRIGITVAAHDPEGAVGAASSTLTVVAKPDAPTSANLPQAIAPERLTVDEDARLALPAGVFPFADADGDALGGITIVDLPLNGTLSVDGEVVQAGQLLLPAELARLEYVPKADFYGNDGFGFRVWDDSGDQGGPGLSSADYRAVIKVQPVPDAPVSGDLPLASEPERLTVDEDGRLPLPATVFPFADADGDALAGVTITALPEHGTLLLAGEAVTVGQYIDAAALATLEYVPLPDYNGSDGFGFKAWDDSGEGRGPGLSSAEHRALITVLPVDDAPTSADLPLVSAPERLSVDEDGRLPLPADVFPFGDADGDAMAGVSIVLLPEHGVLLLDGVAVQAGQFIPTAALATLEYVPNPDYNGPDGFRFRAWDDSGTGGGPGLSSAEHVALITVLPVADAPTSADLPQADDPGRLTVDEDGRLPLPATVFPFADADGDALAGVTITALPEHGTLLLAGEAVAVGQYIDAAALATLEYVPLPDYNGPDGFGFKAWDDSGEGRGPGLSSAEHRALITVLPVDDAPTSADLPLTSDPERLTVPADGRLQLAADLFPFADADGDAMAGISVVALPEHGALLLDGVAVQAGQFIASSALAGLHYEPARGFDGADGFVFRVWDNSGRDGSPGLASGEHRALITVTPAPLPFVFSSRTEASMPNEAGLEWVSPLQYQSAFAYDVIDYTVLLEPFSYPDVDSGLDAEKAFAQADVFEVCTVHRLLGIGCRFVPAVAPGEYLLATGRGALAHAVPTAPGVPPVGLNAEGAFVAEASGPESGFNAPLADAFAHTLGDSSFEGVEPGVVELPAEGLLIVPQPPAGPAGEAGARR
ncbi:Ig-like domain-containing protein [Thauera mechernichensis]